MTKQLRNSLLALAAVAAVSFPPGAGFAQTPSHSDMDPGWTGQTTVLGSHSSLAGTAESTYEHQVGQY
jgi:hypothetical protein